jgi:glucosamine 6-phosphate synthetase-like amidotransferase/phosphosugar isomerase protein
MCGIAGYSVSGKSGLDRTLAAQILLAAISERGSDASGYAFRGPGVPLTIHKQRTAASELLELVGLPPTATQVLLHVRDHTKGHPSLEANNHPIRHGSVVGVHNGVIVNDEELFERYDLGHEEAGMTVDSEAIFALIDYAGPERYGLALEKLYGSMATAWLDERRPGVLHTARGVGRPLWLGQGRHEAFLASTREALDLVEAYAGVELEKSEIPEGMLLSLADGRVVERSSFRLDRSFHEDPLPPLEKRALEERRSCLARLATIAVAAGVTL